MAIHDLNLAGRFCDRLALLHGGRVLAAGAPTAVLRPELIEGAYGSRGHPVEQCDGQGRRRRYPHLVLIAGPQPAAPVQGSCQPGPG